MTNKYTRTKAVNNMTSIDLIERIDLSIRSNPKAKIIFSPKTYQIVNGIPKIVEYAITIPQFKYSDEDIDKVNTLKRIAKCCRYSNNASSCIKLLTLLYTKNIKDFKLKYTQIPTARESEVLKFIIDDIPND